MNSTVLRVAVYARYSTDRQNPLSAEDQIRICREYAQKNGWVVLDNHIYRDEAMTGTNDLRPALKRLLAASLLQPRPFDVLLIDDTSRLSRNMRDTLTISECLKFVGVRLVAVSQGIDTEHKQADLLLKFHGIIDSSYVTGLIEKTRRGMESTFLRKLHAGGRCFGYRNTLVTDSSRVDEHGSPVVLGARLEINPAEAETVRRIFQLFANGYSLKRIAKLLNAEHVRSPRPRTGREQSWCPSSIRVILHNERYCGVLTWGRTRKEANPHTGRKVKRLNNPSECKRISVPEQQIVSGELWAQVQRRIEHVKKIYGEAGRKGGLLRAWGSASPYLFSGLLKCGSCGGNMMLVSGYGKNHREPQYGCAAHAYRGTCGNTLRIGQKRLERELLSYLQQEILREEVIEYTLDKFEQEVKKALSAMDTELDHLRRRQTEIEKRLANFMQVLGNGHYSPTVMEQVSQCEGELTQISDRLRSSKPDSVHQHLRNVRSFALSRLGDVRELLSGDSVQAKAEISKHVQAIVLKPEGRTYKIAGNWNLLGSDFIGRMEHAGGQS